MAHFLSGDPLAMTHSKRFLALVDEARSHITEITPQEVYERQKRGEQFLLLDTREDGEWDEAHITGAKHLGKGVIERDIDTVAPDIDQEIVLYCGGGFRSALAAEALQKMGYTNVRSMVGGWRDWNEKGLPTE